eukprot:TRINITY_DN11023_c0_g1_i2.p1 TRINITY_DN11023_c0_g1~~TRINITY_DN11023_c0_g1_i2.p1  ORF type:complete len:306 (-),score=51.08 TRINITY_DN11023_c0_g1_i2:193-1086(-)
MMEEGEVTFEQMNDEEQPTRGRYDETNAGGGDFPSAAPTFIGGGNVFNAEWVGENTAAEIRNSTPAKTPTTTAPPTTQMEFQSADQLNGGLPVEPTVKTALEDEEIDTLDEPVLTTIWRELKGVGIKLFHVLAPHGKGPAALRDWDLWGPLILCFALEAFLAFGNHSLAVQDEGEHTLVFTVLWSIVWVGSIAITINSTLLGGQLSFFQSVSLIGYCLFPLTVAAFVSTLWSNVWWRLGAVCLGVVWSIGASYGFLTASVPEKRRAMALYPVFLFYVALGWFIFWILGGSVLEESSS